MCILFCIYFFFFQAEDGIRDIGVTGVQTCALPISYGSVRAMPNGEIGGSNLEPKPRSRYKAESRESEHVPTGKFPWPGALWRRISRCQLGRIPLKQIHGLASRRAGP